jgi:hypothetical protein
MLTISLVPATKLAIEVVEGLNKSYKNPENYPTIEKFVDDFWQLFKSIIPLEDYIRITDSNTTPISASSIDLLKQLKKDIKSVITNRSLKSDSTLMLSENSKKVFARVSINPLFHEANAEKSNMNSLLFPIFDNLFKSVIAELAPTGSIVNLNINLGLTFNENTGSFFTNFRSPAEFMFWKNVSLTQLDVLSQKFDNLNIAIETLTTDREFSFTEVDKIIPLMPSKQEIAGIVLAEFLEIENPNIFTYDDVSIDLKETLLFLT